jgi:hypothetical protein
MKSERKDFFELIPEPYQTSLPYFAWIPLVRVLKPEKTTDAIKRYVRKSLSEYFVTPIIFQRREALDESNSITPLLLILTPGNDPME